jgi:hypothetical protein
VQSLENKITLIAREKNFPGNKLFQNQATLLLGGNDTGNPHHPYDTDMDQKVSSYFKWYYGHISSMPGSH